MIVTLIKDIIIKDSISQWTWHDRTFINYRYDISFISLHDISYIRRICNYYEIQCLVVMVKSTVTLFLTCYSHNVNAMWSLLNKEDW